MVAQACSFFYINILRIPYVVPSAFYPRREFKLPEILSEEQVNHLVNSITNAKHRCLIALFYGTGLRLVRERMQEIAAADQQIEQAITQSGYKKWKVCANAPFGGPDTDTFPPRLHRRNSVNTE